LEQVDQRSTSSVIKKYSKLVYMTTLIQQYLFLLNVKISTGTPTGEPQKQDIHINSRPNELSGAV